MDALPLSLQTAFRDEMQESKYFEWNVKGKPDSLEVIFKWTRLQTGPIDRSIPGALQNVIGKAHDKYKYFEWYMKQMDQMTEMYLTWKEQNNGTRNQYSLRITPCEGQAASDLEQQKNTDDKKMITIFVKTLTNATHAIPIDKEATVENLSDVLWDRTGIPPSDRQHLIYNGRTMKNEQSLADYNLHNGSTIHLIFGMRGD